MQLRDAAVVRRDAQGRFDMRSMLRVLGFFAFLACAAHSQSARAQLEQSTEPFKVGTFAIDGVPTVGLVLRDSLVVDIAAANRALELDPDHVRLAMPRDMLELIGQYEYRLRRRTRNLTTISVRSIFVFPKPLCSKKDFASNRSSKFSTSLTRRIFWAFQTRIIRASAMFSEHRISVSR
jgi:hypothetical protein